ncbi:MAG: paraquat-inducible protein A [Candidatus Omnitrophica bacterium]|nr:paraquat-inducible protein A [Candidatus Omnitrophota bacterium]
MTEEVKSLWEIRAGHFEGPALLIFAALFLAAGLSLPVLTVKQLVVMKNTFSILSGIEALWKEKHYALAGIIFFFSIVFPFTKLAALGWIWFAKVTAGKRRALIFWLEFLGKWSMLDVFVVAVTIVAVKFGFMASAEPRVGIYYFAAAIMASMIATSLTGRLLDADPR